MPERFDVFDFQAMFKDVRSVAVVGNAPTVLDHVNGARIDAHDLVVRFNRARVEGLEDRLGSRTDLLVANELNSVAIAPRPASVLQPRCILSFVMREPGFDPEPFRDWAQGVPTLCTLPPDLLGVPVQPRTRLLTQGTYAIYTLLKLLTVERLFVTGFTMFGAVPGGAQKYLGPARRGRGTYHELDLEPRLLAAILNGFQGQLEVTPEIAELQARYGGEGRPKARQELGLYQRLMGRLAWRLIETGVRLRRGLERRQPVQFEDIKW